MSISFEASILRLIPDALIWVRPVFNPQGSIVDFEVGYSNQAADLGINHPRGALAGLHLLRDGVPSAQGAAPNFQHFLDVYQSGEVKEYSFLAHHSGRVYETIRQPHEGGVLSLTRDRSAQREAERREQEASRTLASVVQNSPAGIVFYSAVRDQNQGISDFRVSYYNERSNELTGITARQREALTFREFLRLHGIETALEHYIDVVESGRPLETEYYIPSLQRWLIASVVKLDDGFLSMLSDITGLKQSEERLQQAAHRFETVVNTSKAGMFTLTPVRSEGGEVVDFRFGIVNQAVATYIGQTAEVLTGALASIYFPAYKTNGLFEVYRGCYLNGTSSNFDFHYEDGYDVFFNIDVVKMNDEVLVTFTDHTTLKRLQRELEGRMAELNRSNKNLEEFAHAASHDLKEPLRKIHTFSERLKVSLADRLDEKETGYFERMQMATGRMQLLVDDLLEYSLIGIHPPQKEVVDLNEKLARVLHDLEVPIEEKGARIMAGPLPEVKGYNRQLQQLLQNLISNALKYSQEGRPPVITLSFRNITAAGAPSALSSEPADKPFYLIEVKDNGIGFEQQYAERIFQMFQRLHGKSEYPGSGVGLSIVRKVAENHGGYVTAEGLPGEGATFSVYLPVV